MKINWKKIWKKFNKWWNDPMMATANWSQQKKEIERIINKYLEKKS